MFLLCFVNTTKFSCRKVFLDDAIIFWAFMDAIDEVGSSCCRIPTARKNCALAMVLDERKLVMLLL